MNHPIITSLLDTDFYMFTMGNLIFQRYPDVPVVYGFRNRTKGVRLAEIVNESDLRCELDHVRTLRFNNSELHYLRGTNEYGDRMFPEKYLQFLRELQMPPYELRVTDGTFDLRFPGKWSEAIYWETLALSIVNELYYRALLERMRPFERDVIEATGRIRLAEKIKILRENTDITFTDFGTRRRFAKLWQQYVVRTTADELGPQRMLGTSNTEIAMILGLLPMGTSAHGMFMVLAAMMGQGGDEALHASHNQVLRDWWDTYGFGLSIALTDTFGSDFFFRDMTRDQAHQWKGLRHDSGDPIAFGEKAIRFYRSHDVDPREKLLVFSDGLDIQTILKIHSHFKDRVRVSFGWGTNLTNDLGLSSLSLVVKVIEADGSPAVKLSDNLAKATGPVFAVERYKRVFGYSGGTFEECRY
ncbi:MAG: nicotinate phosphoribosyltransferase [Patescibacteria group bacterium]